MKKLYTCIWAALLTCSLAGMASATRDTSFTFDSTAGIFEDHYDFFKESPAYLPSFQRASLWSQLSNLKDANDTQVGGASSANYYLLGGQASALGVGRLGLMLDWYGANTNFTTTDGFTGGQSGSGFIEDTRMVYRDSNSDGIYDAKSELYGRSKKSNAYNNADIYVAYGLGGLAGLDLGAALRINTQGNVPTYNANLAMPAAMTAYPNTTIDNSFDQNLHWYETNLITGQQTFALTQTETGSLDYSTALTKIILGARASKMIPGLDAVLNVGPVIKSNSNKYTFEYNQNINYDPSAVSDRVSQYKENGIENGAVIDGANVYPGSGIGVLVSARGDYALSKDFTVIGQVGFITAPTTIADAKKDRSSYVRTRQPNGALTQTNDDSVSDNDKYEGKSEDSGLSAQVRGQYQLSKNVKFGMGLNFLSSTVGTSVKTTNTYTRTETLTGTGSPASDFTAITTGGYAKETNTKTVTNTVEFPVGMIINIFDNLPIRFGAKHTITTTAYNKDALVTSRSPQVTQATYGNGATSQTAATLNNLDESNENNLTTTHTNQFYHGATWWPSKDVQIDMTYIYDLLKFGDYRLSMTVYF